MSEDTISRQAAIKAIDEIESEVVDGDGFQYEKWRQYFCDLPSADIDLSDYSDRLWRNAYERGKADAEPRWIPVTERLPNDNSVVVVCGEKGTWDFGTYRGHMPSHINFWNWKKNTVKEVHWWMYKKDALPEPWKGGAE